MHAVGIWLLVKTFAYGVPSAIGEPSPSAVRQPGRLLRMFAFASVPANVGPAEKSPKRSAAVGTVTVSPEVPRRMRSPSYVTKKNVLSLRIGPPSVAPN